jgi:hypothetical protein
MLQLLVPQTCDDDRCRCIAAAVPTPAVPAASDHESLRASGGE